MTIPDCGPLGDVEVTISYKYYAGRKQTQIEPEERASATIHWIKFGGEKGVEVEIDDDYISDEIIPHCIADYAGETEYAAEQYAECLRDMRRDQLCAA